MLHAVACRGVSELGLNLTNFTDPSRPHQECPCLRHMKAARIRGLVSKLALLWHGYVSTAFDRWQLKMFTTYIMMKGLEDQVYVLQKTCDEGMLCT